METYVIICSWDMDVEPQLFIKERETDEEMISFSKNMSAHHVKLFKQSNELGEMELVWKKDQ